MEPKAIILVTADWDALKSYAKKICQTAATQLNVEYKELNEDWDFLTNYGEKDEFGGVEIPQAFIETADGKYIHVMTKVPLNDKGTPDLQKGVQLFINKSKEG
ncbi:MAG: hypothetical protein ACP5T5_04745 [Thermoprotei archaeon]|nr:hypothetical protein [TACK group archaeon]